MNTDKYTFVAVDFEIMTADAASVCAAGVVQVINGIVKKAFYTLVKPVYNPHAHLNTDIHGITPEMCDDGMEYAELHKILCSLTNNGAIPFVCHNQQADMRYLHALEEYYGLQGLNLDSCICTYAITGKKLTEACKEFNIPFFDHHDALADAQACARVYLAAADYKKPATVKASPWIDAEKRKVSKKTLSVPTEDEIKNKNTIFYRSNCVITGTFRRYMLREDLAQDLRSLGADINGAISGKTTIVCVGEDAGQKKLEQIAERQKKGQDIKVVQERELYKILDSAWP